MLKRLLLVILSGGLIIGAFVLLNQLRGGAPARPTPPPTPLTDVAARPRPVAVTPPEDPAVRLARLRAASTQPLASQPTAPPAKVVLPKEMPDPSRPPQWTRPLASPGPPQPPDPFVPPPIVQDPDRGRAPAR